MYNAVNPIFEHIGDKVLNAEKYLFAVSSIKENKNFGIAVNAFKIVQKQIPDLKLYIMGDMNADSFRNMGHLIDECKKDVNIKLLGRVSDSDLIRYYSNAIAFIFLPYTKDLEYLFWRLKPVGVLLFLPIPALYLKYWVIVH